MPAVPVFKTNLVYAAAHTRPIVEQGVINGFKCSGHIEMCLSASIYQIILIAGDWIFTAYTLGVGVAKLIHVSMVAEHITKAECRTNVAAVDVLI